MAEIFKDKEVNRIDIGTRKLEFSTGQLSPAPVPVEFPVTDEENTKTWKFFYSTKNGKSYFSGDDWTKFVQAKGIRIGTKISLYREDDPFRCETFYKIELRN